MKHSRGKVLYIQPIGCEGPGLIESTRPDSLQVEMCRPMLGHPLPSDPSGYSAIIALGGPMSVNETDRYPWLHDNFILLERALDAGIPCLGVCLGSQMLAHCCGAIVMPMGSKEIGWGDIALTDAGRIDPLTSCLPSPTTAFHWHGDKWDLPEGAALLASSEACPHQIFRVGDNAYGLQCHLEITREMPSLWAQAYPDEIAQLEDSSSFMETVDRETAEYFPTLAPHSEQLFKAFWNLALNLP